MKSDKEQNNHIALFKGKAIRKTLHNKEWWFSVIDVVGVLTDSPQPKTYWAKMKERDKDMSQPFPFWEQGYGIKLAIYTPPEEAYCFRTAGRKERDKKQKLSLFD